MQTLLAPFSPDLALPRVVSGGRAGLAFVIVIVAGLAAAAAVGARIDLRPQVLASQGGPGGPGGGMGMGGEPKSDRELDEEITKETAVMRLQLGLSAGLGTPALILLAGVGLYLLGRFVGGKPTMGAAVSATAHASLPFAVKSLLVAGAALRSAALTPDQIPKLVTTPIPGLFPLWSAVLLAFGFCAAAGVSRTKGFITIGVVLLAIKALTLGPHS